MTNRRRTTEPDTAMAVNEKTNWSYLHYAFEELYSYGDLVSEPDWPRTPQLFRKLDVDESGQIEKGEIERLRQATAHLTLLASYGADASEAPATPTLEVESISEELEAQVRQVHTHGNRVTLKLIESEVAFFVNEDAALTRADEVAESQFQLYDRDANRYLDEDELPNALPGYNVPFEGLDTDQDEKVTLDEIVEFLDLRQAAFRGQIRARASDRRDALFAALDSDGDARLTSREMALAPDTLASLDRNQDERLQSHEIPGSMVVGFIRGNPQQDETLFTIPTVAGAQAPSKRPPWFAGMDANGDGEVSEREFLGTTEQFSTFDTNADGFLSPEEAGPS